MILWLGEMSRLFHFCPETFALGVCVLNRLLSAVKVDQQQTRDSNQCSNLKNGLRAPRLLPVTPLSQQVVIYKQDLGRIKAISSTAI